MKLHHYADPGHGWVSVKRQLLIDLGIADKISPYSYQRGQSVYVEEDGDLCLLCNALRAKGESIEWVERHSDKRSPIRSYDSYRKPSVADARVAHHLGMIEALAYMAPVSGR